MFVIAEWTTGDYPYEVFDEKTRTRICAECTKEQAERIANALNR